jgi:hypothetical protein
MTRRGLGVSEKRVLPSCADHIGLAVHDPLRSDYPRPEGGRYGLVAQADAEYRLAAGEARISSMERPADSGLPGPGEITSLSKSRASAWSRVDLVVADDLDLLAEAHEELGEVVGEGIVVVDQEYHHAFPRALPRRLDALRPRPCWRSPRTRARGPNRTTPPPAWTRIFPSFTRAERMVMQESKPPR